MINQYVKGRAYEQKICRELIELGYKDCVTSRSESRRTDDEGIDFVNTGSFAIQAKASERSPSYPGLLQGMAKANKGIPLIFRKQNNKPETVTMLKEDWYKLMDQRIKADHDIFKADGAKL